MLYDVAFAVESEKDIRKAILNKISEYEIYSHYLGHAFQIGKAMSSPFRKDTKPSFSIYRDKLYNGLLHFDFGNSMYAGDCFSFVSQMFPGTSYKEAVQKVMNDIMLGGLKKQLGFTDRKPNEKNTKVKCLIRYEPLIRLSPQAFAYWEEIGLTDGWRAFFKIINAKSLYVEEDEVWTATPENPIFIYKDFDKIKGYRPLESNKSKKWISNTTKFDIQGWEQLPEMCETDHLVITKSKKDVAVLRTLGYLAIAPSAEGVLIPPIAMKLLTEKYGIKKFTILYDRDHGGMTGAKKMFNAYRGTYNITFKFIGRGLPKDVADFRREFGEKSTQRYLLYLLGYEPNVKLKLLPANAA